MDAHPAQPTTEQDFDEERALHARGQSELIRTWGSTASANEPTPTYDARQIGASLVSWRCCRRTVYATRPEYGCLTCR